MIVDGGPTTVGIESTVIDLTTRPPTLLRPGAVSLDTLRSVLGQVATRQPSASDDTAMRSPGMLARHYSPVTPLVLFNGDRETALAHLKRTAADRIERGDSVVVLVFDEDRVEFEGMRVRVVALGPERDPPSVGARLYAALRESDAAGGTVILVRDMTTQHPMSAAIQDRLRRASTR
jgi:L-threonylcarbamoyladenylate synthase